VTERGGGEGVGGSTVGAETALIWDELRHAGPYAIEAYAFVQEGLRETCERLAEGEGGDGSGDAEFGGGSRHVTGQELCIGLRDYAIDCFGTMARTVLEYWGVRRTEDFGKIVFAMIDAGLLRKTDEDTLADFCGVFEFDEAFSRTLEIV
jgi:uncharacterized repeat protein (TIGR04138 family)